MSRLIDRFIKYVKVDTQSDPFSETVPSTSKQKNLSNILVAELQEMGLEAFIDDLGYVYSKLPKNTTKDTYSIGFISHVDTSPDAPGENVSPRIIKNYDGSLITLNETYNMDPERYPSLLKVIGEDIIVTDGNTLLGADDKSGVAEIMEMAHFLVENKDIEHGDIYICFTPDEEIGRGADHFNHDWFKADFAYTADGSEVGGIEYENFNAASAKVTFTGNSIHPGSAKNKLINALHLAMEFHQMLPVFLNPAYTENYEGFNHLSSLDGEVEKAVSRYIIRNHDKELFAKQKNDFLTIAKYLNEKYGSKVIDVEIKDSYYNMYDILKDHMYVVDLAKKAIISTGLVPIVEPIRGGTDGSRLTYDGLICPNLGTGAYHFHGRLEFASINQMEKAFKVLVELAKLSVK
ncbi:Peptidase M20B, peptidase T [Alteracholeplasma palmae J233]|uniref:Peptidase T n=1 Tax=Alteracholeplasma palmae (strain ATCC 49389 / J233) TaxID=1318466 RepID=U4KKA4_ALTPJ|nr:peptidase T [Alteracholeplasma palmae]CCV64129.1 Peptidase M20B, peptidase T [Alteracholeplasma palmae J233]